MLAQTFYENENGLDRTHQSLNNMCSLGAKCMSLWSIKNTSDSGTEQIRSFLINNNTILSHETAHIMLSQAHRLAVELWCLLTIQSIITSLRIKC